MKRLALVVDEVYADKKHEYIVQRVIYSDNSKGFRICLSDKDRFPVILFKSPFRVLVWSIMKFGFKGVQWMY